MQNDFGNKYPSFSLALYQFHANQLIFENLLPYPLLSEQHYNKNIKLSSGMKVIFVTKLRIATNQRIKAGSHIRRFVTNTISNKRKTAPTGCGAVLRGTRFGKFFTRTRVVSTRWLVYRYNCKAIKRGHPRIACAILAKHQNKYSTILIFCQDQSTNPTKLDFIIILSTKNL